jgi:hypothetical protein
MKTTWAFRNDGPCRQTGISWSCVWVSDLCWVIVNIDHTLSLFSTNALFGCVSVFLLFEWLYTNLVFTFRFCSFFYTPVEDGTYYCMAFAGCPYFHNMYCQRYPSYISSHKARWWCLYVHEVGIFRFVDFWKSYGPWQFCLVTATPTFLGGFRSIWHKASWWWVDVYEVSTFRFLSIWLPHVLCSLCPTNRLSNIILSTIIVY